ncbi:MAG: SiaC family regulatory phosphoprotein [Bacteroidia bacterium]|nr:SiaC family regulatory phosphoprotein [Bacteroidia bacterium]
MGLNEVHILPTKTTPEITLNPKGIVKIKGRAIDESRDKAPEQMTNWIDEYVLNPAPFTEVIIALEFLNSFNTLVLTATLKRLAQVVQRGKKIGIRWYYEEDDVDIFERGEYISATVNVHTEFIKTDDVGNC